MSEQNRVDFKASVLETQLESGNIGKVNQLLQWEAQNKPEEFNDVVRAFQKMNSERLQQNGSLPKVSLHEDGGFFGLGSSVDDVKISVKDNSTWRGKRTFDVYDTPAESAQKAQQETLQHYASEATTIYGVNQSQPAEVNTLFRSGYNMFRAGNRFGGWHNQESGGVHTRNGEELPQVQRSYLR